MRRALSAHKLAQIRCPAKGTLGDRGGWAVVKCTCGVQLCWLQGQGWIRLPCIAWLQVSHIMIKLG
jgi:hypothetical protein